MSMWRSCCRRSTGGRSGDVIDLASGIGLEHDVLLSPTVLDRETFERWRAQERLFVMDILREGLPL